MDTECQLNNSKSWKVTWDEAETSKGSQCVKSKSVALAKEQLDNNDSLPNYLQELVYGKEVGGDSYDEFSPPDWFDTEKFQRGQRFALDHTYGIMYAELLSLMILFSFRAGLEPLIFTGKSDTPFKAFKRYLSTAVRVKSWYEGDIWNVDSLAHKNLKNVRRIHDAIRKTLNSLPRDEVAKRVTLENDEGSHPMWKGLGEEILDDFQASCPVNGSPLNYPEEIYINQCDMALTQFGFLGLILVYPQKFGIHYASDADLDCFAHFWRTIGYLLGTADRFNLCNGDLATVQQRCRDIVQFWVKPALLNVSRDWIHMSWCLMEGISFYIPGVSIQVPLMYLCHVLEIKASKLAASMTYRQYFVYLVTVFVFWFVLRLPGMWRLHNGLVNEAVKSAQHMSAERLSRLEERVYPYEWFDATSEGFDLSE